MSFKLYKSSKATIIGTAVAVLLFVSLLMTLPFHVSQKSKQNSSAISAQYLIDPSFNAELKDITQAPDADWTDTSNTNFGLSNQPHWIRFILPAASTAETRMLLIDYALLDKVNIWFLGGGPNKPLLAAYATGDSLPYDHRRINYEQFLFTVPRTQNQSVYVYIRVESKGPLKVPLELWQESDFVEYSSIHKLFMGLFFGYLTAMGLSNLFIYTTTRNNIFAIYSGYVTSVGLAVASVHGFAFHYIWPTFIWLQEFSVVIFSSTTVICIILLANRLLALKEKAPNSFRMLNIIKYFYLALLVSCMFAPYQVVVKVFMVLLLLSTPIILGAGALLAIKPNNLVAKYFCSAWAILLISGLAVAIENLGIYTSPVDSSYMIMVGAITEALLLSFALAISFNEKLQSAQEARDNALQNEHEALEAKEELISLQEQNRSDLQYSVEERTLELEIALRELAEKNRELEKLSAIDPLTGLMNRRYFDKRLLAESRRSRRELSPLAIALLDIDHFKRINDTHGHLCGDHCLKVFAGLVKEMVKRPADVVCRYGGEEFVLILPNTDLVGLKKLLEKIRKAVAEKRILFEGTELSMTVSIGACSRTMASDDEHAIIVGFVDKLLYQAKASGRNRVEIDSY